MKNIWLCLVVGFTWALSACIPPENPVQITITRPAATSIVEMPTSLATDTPVPPSSTLLPPTLAPSQTPMLDIATATPEPTATLEPFTQGRIIYLWNDEPRPPETEALGPYELEPTVNMYLAQPGVTPEEWHIQPLLTKLRIYPPAYPSPDETKIALRILEDSERYRNGIYRIHVYSLTDGSLRRIENQANLHSLSWLPDNQMLVYSQETNIALTDLEDLRAHLLTNNPTEPIENAPFISISHLVGAPNGRWQAMIVSSGTGVGNSGWLPGQKHLALFDIDRSETITITEVPGDSFLTLRWSPDSQWLAFTRDYGLSLFVVHVNDHIVLELAAEPTSIYYPAWSPDGRWLAFTQSSSLFIWDSETATTRELTSAYYVGEPAWSPDGTTIAAGFVEEDRYGILLLDPISGSRQELILGMIPARVYWSPDGQWLLFHAGQNEQTGLYIINRNGGPPYLVVDTTGKQNALEYFTWLSG